MAHLKQEDIMQDTLYEHPVPHRGRSQSVTMTSDSDPPHVNAESSEELVELGNHARRHIAVIKKLQTLLTASNNLYTLPRVVVCGDQSAGKSSIVEAICDISMPRSTDTCTRCPFELTTTRGDVWSCRVSLVNNYIYDPAALHHTEFDGWRESIPNVVPFVTITSTADLDKVLRQAQLAVLNPGRDPKSYLGVDPATQTLQTDFSPNVVSLTITGQELPELSFFDLPGAINNYQPTCRDADEENSVPKFVESLIKKYIGDSGTIVLFACAASQDLATSTALRFIIDCKARERTIGVLTKADLLSHSDVETPMKVLSNQGFWRLGHSWFLTKLRTQDELNAGLSHQDAMHREKLFFSKEPYTSAAGLASFAERFGIAHLRRALSVRLTKSIVDEIPNIEHGVKEQIRALEHKLSKFPPPTEAPGMEVQTEIDRVRDAIANQISTAKVNPEFRKQYQKLMREMRGTLHKRQPEISVVTPGYQAPTIPVDSSAEEEESPKKRRKTQPGHMAATTPDRAAKNSGQASRSTRSKTGDPKTGERKRVFPLSYVVDKFESSTDAAMPNTISSSVIFEFMLEMVHGLDDFILEIVNKHRADFQAMLQRVVVAALATRKGTRLVEECKASLCKLMHEVVNTELDHIKHSVASHTHRPITYAQHYFAEREQEFVQELGAQRLKQRSVEHFAVLESQGGKVPTVLDQEKLLKSRDWVKEHLGSDPYELQVKAMAQPLSYYYITCMELVDTVAKDLDLGMHNFQDRIARTLREDLRTEDINHCAQLLADDPKREERRLALVEEKQRLLNALDELCSLPGVTVERA